MRGVILSAGEGSRMGKHKALLEFGDGTTLLARQVALLKSAGCEEIAVVIGAQADEIRSGHPALDVKWIVNREWQKGQFSSVQAGVSWVHGTCVVLLPVDVVGVSSDTIKALIETAIINPHLDAVIPEYETKGGHPVCVLEKFCGRILGIPPDGQDVRMDRQLKLADTIHLPVNDEAVVRNVNTKDEWLALAHN